MEASINRSLLNADMHVFVCQVLVVDIGVYVNFLVGPFSATGAKNGPK